MHTDVILNDEPDLAVAAQRNALVVRPGTAADSPELFRVFSRTAFDLRLRLGQARPEDAPDTTDLDKEWSQLRPLYDHLAQTADHLWVAQRNNHIVGFARSMLRDGVRSLTEFWVLPQEQEAGLGRELLRRAFPADDARYRYIIATVDTRAQARYMKAGLYPRFPLYVFKRTPQIRRFDTDLDFKPMPETPVTAQIIDRLDQEILGYRRRPEHTWFRQNRHGYLYYRNGEPVGYGYAGKQSGPFALLDNRDFAAVLAHAETAVSLQGHSKVEFVTPTVNETAVDHLLAHGYRLQPFFCQLMTSRPFGRFDHYVATSPMFAL